MFVDFVGVDQHRARAAHDLLKLAHTARRRMAGRIRGVLIVMRRVFGVDHAAILLSGRRSRALPAAAEYRLLPASSMDGT